MICIYNTQSWYHSYILHTQSIRSKVFMQQSALPSLSLMSMLKNSGYNLTLDPEPHPLLLLVVDHRCILVLDSARGVADHRYRVGSVQLGGVGQHFLHVVRVDVAVVPGVEHCLEVVLDPVGLGMQLGVIPLECVHLQLVGLEQDVSQGDGGGVDLLLEVAHIAGHDDRGGVGTCGSREWALEISVSSVLLRNAQWMTTSHCNNSISA